jgi:sporulation protein YlmC with PRC-barrel domain
MADVKDPSDTSGRLIAARKVNGTNVYNTVGEKLGSVYDVMIDKRSGNAEYAIMSFGGFLGIGDSYHPLPWPRL